MGLTLYFLRHGQAGDSEEWQGDDGKRPLTADGKKRMQREAAGIKALRLPLTLILTSPLTRAQQTAEIVAETLGIPVAADDRLVPGLGASVLRPIVQEHRKASALMLVGHEPDFGDTVSQLTGGSRVIMKKGGLAAVELDSPDSVHGSLLWLIPPKILEAL